MSAEVAIFYSEAYAFQISCVINKFTCHFENGGDCGRKSFNKWEREQRMSDVEPKTTVLPAAEDSETRSNRHRVLSGKATWLSLFTTYILPNPVISRTASTGIMRLSSTALSYYGLISDQ